MQLYVSDYLGDTRHLSCEQHGAYLLLLMTMWNAGGSLPNDDVKLARIVGCSLKKWRALKDDVVAFFDVDERLTHGRLTKELLKSEDKSEKRASAGSAGGAAKALKDKERAIANATILPQHLPDTITRKEEDANASKARARKSDPEFEDWYARYPHKVQRGAAERAFVKARKLASLEDLIRGVHSYIATKPEDRQWQNPATWLNGKGWMDEPAGFAIRNAQWPPGGPRSNDPFAALAEISRAKGWSDEPASLPRNHQNDQRVPPEREERHGAVVDLRRGPEGDFRPSDLRDRAALPPQRNS